jgi:hypothetical protein
MAFLTLIYLETACGMERIITPRDFNSPIAARRGQ